MKLFVWEWPDGTFGGHSHAPTRAKARSGHNRFQHYLVTETFENPVSLAHRIREATPQEAKAYWAGLSETPEEYWATQEAALEKFEKEVPS
jgi:hypothetical protein